jgi:hypothetical protein
VQLKYVNILDRRLGVTKLIFTLLITICKAPVGLRQGPCSGSCDASRGLADVALYEIWYRGGYLASSDVSGYVRFQVQQPTNDTCDPR